RRGRGGGAGGRSPRARAGRRVPAAGGRARRERRRRQRRELGGIALAVAGWSVARAVGGVAPRRPDRRDPETRAGARRGGGRRLARPPSARDADRDRLAHARAPRGDTIWNALGASDSRGQEVVAAAGIADPTSFAAQLTAAGARVQLLAYQDHHAYGPSDLGRLVRAASAGGYVVVTEKDAVILRGRWPEGIPEPLVAVLGIRWERDGGVLEQALDAALAPLGRSQTPQMRE